MSKTTIYLFFALVTFILALHLMSQTPEEEPAMLTLSGSAGFTWYESYPRCCKDSPNYDPKAPTDECTKYDGCKWKG